MDKEKYVDNFNKVTYNNITNACKTTTHIW